MPGDKQRTVMPETKVEGQGVFGDRIIPKKDRDIVSTVPVDTSGVTPIGNLTPEDEQFLNQLNSTPEGQAMSAIQKATLVRLNREQK